MSYTRTSKPCRVLKSSWGIHPVILGSEISRFFSTANRPPSSHVHPIVSLGQPAALPPEFATFRLTPTFTSHPMFSRPTTNHRVGNSLSHAWPRRGGSARGCRLSRGTTPLIVSEGPGSRSGSSKTTNERGLDYPI